MWPPPARSVTNFARAAIYIQFGPVDGLERIPKCLLALPSHPTSTVSFEAVSLRWRMDVVKTHRLRLGASDRQD
jgi:hypothetical protein